MPLCFRKKEYEDVYMKSNVFLGLVLLAALIGILADIQLLSVAAFVVLAAWISVRQAREKKKK